MRGREFASLRSGVASSQAPAAGRRFHAAAVTGIDRYGGWLLALLLLVSILSVIYLVTLLGLRSAKRVS